MAIHIDGIDTRQAKIVTHEEVKTGFTFNMYSEGVHIGLYEVTRIIEIEPVTVH